MQWVEPQKWEGEEGHVDGVRIHVPGGEREKAEASQQQEQWVWEALYSPKCVIINCLLEAYNIVAICDELLSTLRHSMKYLALRNYPSPS